MPLFLIGIETCWEGRIYRQKRLRNYIGSIVSIWWTLCGSPEKNSDPSVFSGYVRRGYSLINIIKCSGQHWAWLQGEVGLSASSSKSEVSLQNTFFSYRCLFISLPFPDFCRPSKGWPGDVIIQSIRVTELGLWPHKSDEWLTRQEEENCCLKNCTQIKKNINTNLSKVNLSAL